MISYLIVLLNKDSTSFCYYENESYYNSESELISFELLEEIIIYAIKNNITLNFLYGNQQLPDNYEKLIDTIDHEKILPIKLNQVYSDGVFVINEDDRNFIPFLNENEDLNLILRLPKDDLPTLSETINSLLGKFKRLNLSILNIESFSEQDLEIYEKQLKMIGVMVVELYKSGQSFELNFISDRLSLNKMNNCDAGIKHLTIAPNGKFYICPGFYYDNEDDCIGDLVDGINIKNQRLLTLDNSPICRICDAYHCKRCVYLNNKITLEINTPSHQQCVLSHLERNSTVNLLNLLDSSKINIENAVSIPEIDYLDPIDILEEKRKERINLYHKEKKNFN